MQNFLNDFTVLRRQATRHRAQATVRRHQTIHQHRRITSHRLQQILQVHYNLLTISNIDQN